MNNQIDNKYDICSKIVIKKVCSKLDGYYINNTYYLLLAKDDNTLLISSKIIEVIKFYEIEFMLIISRLIKESGCSIKLLHGIINDDEKVLPNWLIEIIKTSKN